MEKNQNNQGNQNGNNLPENNGSPKEKIGFKGFLKGIHRKYDEIRYSKAGKWIMRGLTAVTILGTGKACYDKGRASVKPTVVTIEKIPEPEEATEEEAPAEETEEETV